MSKPARQELLALLQQFTVETERYIEAISSRDALHRTDLNALSVMVSALRAGSTVTPGSLRRALNLSSPATTALIDRLDHSGHVTRARSGSDRRQVELELTDKAIATGSVLFAPLAARIGSVFEDYDEEQLMLMTRFMEAVVAATADAREDIAGASQDAAGTGSSGSRA